MNIKRIGIVFTLLTIIGLMLAACSEPKLPTAPTAPMPGVTTLWPDVPPYPEATPNADLNFFFNTAPTANDVDRSIQYYTAKTPAEIAAFYTDALMKDQGWTPQAYNDVKHFSVGHGQGQQINTVTDNGGCSLFDYHGQPNGLCWFSKKDDQGREIDLTIGINQDSKNNRINLDYSRVILSDHKK